jgi:death on curing protein
LPNEPRWLPIEAVIEHNRLEAEATGEPHHLRDRGLLESALARPRNFFGFGEEDIVALAVVLMAGIAWAHAFEQANKRTAFEAMWHFLRLNGCDLAIEDSRPWADRIIALVEHRSTEEDFVRVVRPFVFASE